MMPIRRNNQEWLPSIFSDFFDNNWMFRTNTTAPAINVIEHKTDYQVEVAVPGMTKEDLSVHLTDDNQLVIEMEKKDKIKNDSSKYLHREFSYSKFQQTLVLPNNIDKEHINACVNDGVLTIDLPKKTPEEQDKKCKTIEVK